MHGLIIELPASSVVSHTKAGAAPASGVDNRKDVLQAVRLAARNNLLAPVVVKNIQPVESGGGTIWKFSVIGVNSECY